MDQRILIAPPTISKAVADNFSSQTPLPPSAMIPLALASSPTSNAVTTADVVAISTAIRTLPMPFLLTRMLPSIPVVACSVLARAAGQSIRVGNSPELPEAILRLQRIARVLELLSLDAKAES